MNNNVAYYTDEITKHEKRLWVELTYELQKNSPINLHEHKKIYCFIVEEEELRSKNRKVITRCLDCGAIISSITIPIPELNIREAIVEREYEENNEENDDLEDEEDDQSDEP